MEKLCLVTSVFHIRKSRPLAYYLTPAIHLLEDFANSEVNVCLFTDQPEEVFPRAPNISIRTCTPEALIRPIWNDPNWRNLYTKRAAPHEKNMEHRTIPELIAIWLGKLPMMTAAAEMGDVVLWQDSGIRMPKLFNKDFRNYKKTTIFPELYIAFTQKMSDLYPMTFMKCDMFFNPYWGVRMRNYHPTHKTLIRAGFILARSSEIAAFQQAFKDKWELLISRGDYGTEENPLTLCYWDRPDSSILSFDEWFNGLRLR